MTEYLPPDPHVLLSFINRGLPWSKVISEFVDNGFDEAAGNSQTIRIEVRKGSVTIIDFGRGIEDINRLGILGASASYHYEGNIGQYGIGAKAWFCKARRLDVETCHDGRLHRHTFDLRPVLEALASKRSPPWLNAYSGKGRRVVKSSPTYTRVSLRDFHPEAGSIFVAPLIHELQTSYWPGLIDGRKIEIHDYRRRQVIKNTVSSLTPPSWSDRLTFESTVNNRRYKATIGILNDNIGRYSGLFVGFLFRNICIEKTLPNRAVPPRIHGQIALSGDWRDSLSNYKDEIIKDRDALMLDVERLAREVLDEGNDYTEELRLDGVASVLEKTATKAIRANEATLRLVSTKREKPSEPARELAKQEDTDKRSAEKKPPVVEQASAKNRDQSGENTRPGIHFRFQHLGYDTLGDIGLTDRTVTVTLNQDCRKLEALSHQTHYPGLYLAIGNELAMKCLDLTIAQIEYYFGAMLGEAAGSENRADMMRAIRTWWGFIAEEQDDKPSARRQA